MPTFAPVIAEVAQLVEHNLAKVRVAGSSPVFVRVAGSSPVFRSKQRAVRDRFLYVVIAQVAELVDALVSGASGFAVVQVRVLFWAHH